ncbi:MAG: SelB C-terminal domain-containing protein, partial [Acidithiobacillales bacterium]
PERLPDLLLREAGAAGLTARALGQRLGVPEVEAAKRLETLASSGRALRLPTGLHAHASVAEAVVRRAEGLFSEREKSGTATLSFTRGEFLEKLGRGLPREAAEGWLGLLLAAGKLAAAGDRVSPPGAAPSGLSGGAEGFAGRVEEGFRAAGWAPPRSADLAASLGTKAAVVDGLAGHLLKRGALVRISPDLVVHRDVLAAAERKLESVKGQTLSVAGFRDLWGLTRKTLIPLLEYLDGKKKTRRVGDLRKVE